MGFRTVVVLCNDQTHIWEKDAELGEKISRSASTLGDKDWAVRFPYGEVVECVHADTQTLAILDGYGGRSVAHTFWHREQDHAMQETELLKKLAEKHGFRLVRKTVKKHE